MSDLGGSVILAHGKHDVGVYETALGILEERVRDGYWYDNWDDGNPKHRWADRARAILDGTHFKRGGQRVPMDDETREELAWRFLSERCDHEYEYVERQWVR